MAGTVSMIQDVTLPDTGGIATNRRNWYLACFKMFTAMEATSGLIERVGLFGDETWGYSDEGNPVQDGGWSLWRMPAANAGSLRNLDYYVLIANLGGNFASQLPEYGNSNIEGIGFGLGQREDGGNPWGGALANAGADAKSDPVWADGGSRAQVLPRSNNDFSGTGPHSPGGRSASREALSVITGVSFNMASRWAMVIDADNIFISLQRPEAGPLNEMQGCALMGPATVLTGITYPATIDPMYQVVAAADGVRPGSQLYGTLAHNDSLEEGGIFSPNPAHGPQGVYQDATGVTRRATVTQQPNALYDAGPRFQMWPIALHGDESPGEIGTADPDFIRAVIGTPNSVLSTVDPIQRAFLSNNNAVGAIKYAVAWPSAQAPGSSGTRAGVIT